MKMSELESLLGRAIKKFGDKEIVIPFDTDGTPRTESVGYIGKSYNHTDDNVVEIYGESDKEDVKQENGII